MFRKSIIVQFFNLVYYLTKYSLLFSVISFIGKR